tara:strand:+ start:17 stop:499 length:483 start_codon:yes stop_codon:yes gene_type:complete
MEKTYWNNNGKYQSINDVLWQILVPRTGQAETEQGEALRIVSKIYYDYYNNGCCNLVYKNSWEEIENGEYEEYWDFKIKEDYEKQIEYLLEYLGDKIAFGETPQLIEMIEDDVQGYTNYRDNSTKFEKYIEDLVNRTIEKVMTDIKTKLTPVNNYEYKYY